MSNPAIHPTQCRFCSSCRCHVRIYTRGLGFDEVACNRHIRELECLANGTLKKGTKRLHYTGMTPVSRGEPSSGLFDEMEAFSNEK